MKATNASGSVNRRTALAGLGAGSLGLALLSGRQPVLADHMSRAEQEFAKGFTADHAAVGMWLLVNPTTPPTPSILMLTPDGLAVSSGVVSRAIGAREPKIAYLDGAKNADRPAIDANVLFSSPSMGTWEAAGTQAIHLSLTTIETDADGGFTGTLTVDTYHQLDADGMALTDDGVQTTRTVRDASLAQVAAVAGVATTMPPLIARRMGAGQSGFDDTKPEGGTTESGSGAIDPDPNTVPVGPGDRPS